MDLPRTTRSGSYTLKARGSVEPMPPNGIRSLTSEKNGFIGTSFGFGKWTLIVLPKYRS